MKLKATKLDVDAPKLSRKRRTATRTEEFLGGKTAPEYAEDYFLLSQNIFGILRLYH